LSVRSTVHVQRFAVSALVAITAWLGLPANSEAAGFRRGPYLQDLGPRQVAVMMELDSAHSVAIEVAAGVAPESGAPGTSAKAKKVPAAGVDVLHEIVIGGLEPATTYRYSVVVDDGTVEGGTFTTAPEDDRPFKFLLYGDNRTDDASHAAIVGAMKNAPGDFLVQTGDMVADGTNESNWLGFFGIERELLRHRCLFPAIGNHEVWLPTSDGAQRFARMFRLPSPANAAERYYTFRWGSARFFMLDAQDEFASEEREWLESALDAADGEVGLTWRFVVLHNGPFSSGLHGPNRSLHLARVPDLLRRHRVDLVMSGHDHIYERGEANGVKYLISGGGGAPVYTQHHDEPTALRFEAVHHFVSIDLSRTGGSFTAIRKDGSIIERCTFAPGGVPGWGCPDVGPTGAAIAPTPGATPDRSTSWRRACDCSFTLSGTEWVGAAIATVLLVAAGFRRKTRPDADG
jgi:acid phosphatase type 7